MVTTRSHHLEPLHVGTTHEVTRYAMHNYGWEHMENHLRETMIFKLDRYLMRERVFEEPVRLDFTALTPRSRWQAWKAKDDGRSLITGVGQLVHAIIARLRPPRFKQLHYEATASAEVWAAFPALDESLYPVKFGAPVRHEQLVFDGEVHRP